MLFCLYKIQIKFHKYTDINIMFPCTHILYSIITGSNSNIKTNPPIRHLYMHNLLKPHSVLFQLETYLAPPWNTIIIYLSFCTTT